MKRMNELNKNLTISLEKCSKRDDTYEAPVHPLWKTLEKDEEHYSCRIAE